MNWTEIMEMFCLAKCRCPEGNRWDVWEACRSSLGVWIAVLYCRHCHYWALRRSTREQQGRSVLCDWGRWDPSLSAASRRRLGHRRPPRAVR